MIEFNSKVQNVFFMNGELSMKNKKSNTILIIQGVLFIILIIGAAYAYLGTFNINLNNNIAVNINSTSPGNLSFIANSTQLNLQVPDTSMTKYNANNSVAAKEDTGFVDITLTGTEGFLTTCSYDLVYEYNTNSDIYGKTVPVTTGATKEITIEVNGMNGNNHFATETNFNFDTSKGWSNATSTKGAKVTLVTGATLKSLGTEQSVRWKVIGRYYNLDLNQYALSGKSFTGKIYVENVNCSSEDGTTVKKGYETILANNGGTASMTTLTSTDFATVTTENDKGMYKAPDDLGTSYYFRGAVDNNWVKYGKYTKDMYNCNNGTISATDTGNSCTKIASSGDDIYWRIIRINGDGSIRMIYSGVKAPTESTKVIKTEDTSLGVTVFNANTDSSEYVGYMYTLGQQHGTSKSSDIKTYLDNWYANYTDLNKTGTKITDQIYCNDRTASTSDVAYSTTDYTTLTSWNSTGTNYYYGANGRVWNNPVSPDYKCPVVSDKFTTTTAKGNGKLSYPVGLITADEITFAGLPAGKTNNSFYLHTRAYYWAGSPFGFFGSRSDGFIVFDDGYLDNDYVNNFFGVRGVVSLSSEANLIGDGTWNNVYEVASDKPTVKNISISGKNVTATLSGEKGLTGYAISKSTSTPKNWVSISGKSYNLNTNVQEEGRNYLWVKDAKGNTTTQEIVVLLGTSFDTTFVANNNDLFNHNGIRYEGANPNNYICLDNNTTGSCSNKNLLFRIIGLFEEELTGSSIMNNSRSKLLKIISTTNYGTSRWAASSLSSNDYNLNNWEQSDIATTLNNNYIGNLFNISEFHSKFANQRNGLAQAKWHLGGANSSTYNWEQVTAADMYAIERNTSAVYSSNPSYSFGYVGLMYPSDYGYAAKGCQSTKLSELHNNQTCLDNNWLYQSQLDTFNNILDEWLISPSSANANNVSIIRKGYVQASGIDSTDEYNYRPVFYLDSKELSIAGGEGTSTNPYHIR